MFKQDFHKFSQLFNNNQPELIQLLHGSFYLQDVLQEYLQLHKKLMMF